MKRFLLTAFLVLATLGPVFASTHTAASCTEAAFETARVAAEADTDATVTLALPACTTGATWTSNHTVTIPATATTFILKGAGSDAIVGGNDQTVILDDLNRTGFDAAMLGVLTHSGGCFRMYGLTVQGSGNSTAITSNGSVRISGSTTCMRLDHNHIAFVHNTGILTSGALYGVVDHNIFENSAGSALKFFASEWGGYTEGDGSWAAATELGSAKFIYLEDNQFNCAASGGSIQDSYLGSRFAIRFNTIVNCGTQTHPTGGSGRARGTRAWEIYANSVTATGNLFNFFFLSSGTGTIWGNTLPTGATGFSNFVTLHSMRRDNSTYTQTATPGGWGYCGTSFNGTGSNWDENSSASTGYRCLDQPGRGIGDRLSGSFSSVTNVATGCTASSACAWPRQAIEPIYEWSNTWASCAGCGGSFFNNNFTGNGVIVADADYYLYTGSFNGTSGVGVGTLAARPATCTTGVFYFASDQGSWNDGSNPIYTADGLGYKCTATNTWTLYYTPFTYPHPLVSDDPPTPPVPTKLTFTDQPSNAAEGESLGTVAVAIQTAAGATVTSATSTVTMALTDSPDGTLSGLLSVAAVAGVATFTDLNVRDGTGMDYNLLATSAGLTSATSADFDITDAPEPPPVPPPSPDSGPISGAPLPFVQQQFFNGPGLANVSGFVCTYAAGSTTPLQTYRDNDLSLVNQNPIRLNTAGRPSLSSSEVQIFVRARAYKIVVYARGTGNRCNGVDVGPVISTRDNIRGYTMSTAANLLVGGSVTSSGQLTAGATNKAPVVVRSTTPVDNLVVNSETYSNGGTLKSGVKHITGTVALSGGTASVTLSGASIFTGTSNYVCTATDETSAAPVRVVRVSASNFTLAGTTTNTIAYSCIGN